MQEIMKDESIGNTYIADSFEDLVPLIKKSLENPNVKFVKVFKGMLAEKEKFTAEEEKKNMMDEINSEGKKF